MRGMIIREKERLDFAGIEFLSLSFDDQHKKKIGESICIRKVYRAG